MARISGWSICIRRWDTICFRNSGHQQQPDDDGQRDDRDADVVEQVVEERQAHEQDLEHRRERPREEAEGVRAELRGAQVRMRRDGGGRARAWAPARVPGSGVPGSGSPAVASGWGTGATWTRERVPRRRWRPGRRTRPGAGRGRAGGGRGGTRGGDGPRADGAVSWGGAVTGGVVGAALGAAGDWARRWAARASAAPSVPSTTARPRASQRPAERRVVARPASGHRTGS